MTLDPPAEAGQTIGISYHGADATTASKVQDLAGNAAAAFLANASPVPVQNITPGVESVAFAGTAQTYAIDDKVAVDIVFTQAVAVATSSARPELSLTVGVNTRKARYVSGTGSATLRFEYTIVAGDEDGDGVAIPADSLSTPFGSAIVTVAGSRTVQFGHDAVAADPARTVDGVRPKATAASVAGPTVTVTWSEALDEAAVPDGRGRVHGAHRHCRRPGGDGSRGVGLDDGAEPGFGNSPTAR